MTIPHSTARRVLAVAALLIIAGTFTAAPTLACGGPCPTETPKPEPTKKPPEPTKKPPEPTKAPPVATRAPEATKAPPQETETTKRVEPTTVQPASAAPPQDNENDNRSRSRSQRRDDNENSDNGNDNDGDEDNQNEGRPAAPAQPAGPTAIVYVQPIKQELTVPHAPLTAPEPTVDVIAEPEPVPAAPIPGLTQIDNPPAGPVYVPERVPTTGDGSSPPSGTGDAEQPE